MQPGQSLKSKPSARLDWGTLAGLLLAVGCIVAGLVFEGGKVSDIAQATAALIVLGGTLGSVLVTTPLKLFVTAVRRSAAVFVVSPQPFARTLTNLIAFADAARKAGITSLEDCAVKVQDPFFVKALNLAADGALVPQIREIMLLDLDCEQQRAEAEVRVWENAAGYSPTIGIIGAVLGLIQVMKHLENLDEVGRGIAVAFVATIYGVAMANVILLPVAGKLRTRACDLERLHEMMMEGVIGIVEGVNPSLMRIRLTPFLGSEVEATSMRPRQANQAPRPMERIHVASQ